MEEISFNLIYVACPYSDSDIQVVKTRIDSVTKYLAVLAARRQIAFSPLLMHYCLDSGVELPKDYEFWCNHSLTLLGKSDIMHVLTLPGWDLSIGVLDEIEFAEKNGIPIEYVKSPLS
jgi:hypothetical protein